MSKRFVGVAWAFQGQGRFFLEELKFCPLHPGQDRQLYLGVWMVRGSK